jgi:hypothetical protein
MSKKRAGVRTGLFAYGGRCRAENRRSDGGGRDRPRRDDFTQQFHGEMCVVGLQRGLLAGARPCGGVRSKPRDFSMSRHAAETVEIPARLLKRFVETLCLAA